LKAIIKIALVLGITLSAVMQSRGQIDLPMACVDSDESYWVQGINGSLFTWKITYQDGSIVPASFITFTGSGRGDSIQIHWDASLKGGIYTFEVVEFNPTCGGTGAPYTQDIILNSPTINISFDGARPDVAVCFGNLAALDPGANYHSYLWLDDNSTNQIYYTGEAGTYKVELVSKVDQSCTYDSIKAVINPLPNVWLGNDTVLFNNQSLLLDVFDPAIQTYQWSTTLDNVSSVTAYYNKDPQTIWVKVIDENSCENSDTIIIRSSSLYDIRIPAVFTPNGDEINDKWVFPGKTKSTDPDLNLYLSEVEVKVFNRWGKLVWQTDNDEAWDGRDLNGKALPMDSYHYIIKFKLEGKTYMKKGSVTIVR